MKSKYTLKRPPADTLTATPWRCPNCCCHPCASVSSAADWGSSPDPCFFQTVRENLSWRGAPLSARDCENDLHVRGDSRHACDPVTHTQGKHTDLVQNGPCENLKLAENSSISHAIRLPGLWRDDSWFSDLWKLMSLFEEAWGCTTSPHQDQPKTIVTCLPHVYITSLSFPDTSQLPAI